MLICWRNPVGRRTNNSEPTEEKCIFRIRVKRTFEFLKKVAERSYKLKRYGLVKTREMTEKTSVMSRNELVLGVSPREICKVKPKNPNFSREREYFSHN